MFRSWLRIITWAGAWLLAMMALPAAQAKTPNTGKAKKEVALPFEVRRAIDDVLADFGQMATPYRAASGLGPVIIEIQHIGNQSSSDKLPTDLSQYARNVLDKIGILNYKALPEAFDAPHIAGSALAQLERPRPTAAPPLTYRLVGSLERATEVRSTDKEKRGDGMGGGGHTQWDASATKEQTSVVTALTIALTLENPDGTAIPGASVEYRSEVEKAEHGHGISLYVAGSGVFGGSKVVITDESADALYETVAMGIIQVLGNAMQIPYYRLSSQFRQNPALEMNVRESLERSSQAQLERRLKYYMIVDGDLQGRTGADLTPMDRAMVMLEMRHRSIEPPDRSGMIELSMQLWRSMDYQAGSRRVRRLVTDITRDNAELAEARARQQADLFVSPTEFNWPTNSQMLVLDLSRINDAAAQDRILMGIRARSGYVQIVRHSQKPSLFGIRAPWKKADLQYAIGRSTSHYDYVWYDTPSPRLLVVPLKN